MVRGTLAVLVVFVAIVAAQLIQAEPPAATAQDAAIAAKKSRRFADILKVGDYFEFRSRGGNLYSLQLLDAQRTQAMIQNVLEQKKIFDELNSKEGRTEAESAQLTQAQNALGQVSKRPHRIVEVGEDFFAYESIQAPNHKAIVYLPLSYIFSIEQPMTATESDFWPSQSRPFSRSEDSMVPFRSYGGIR